MGNSSMSSLQNSVESFESVMQETRLHAREVVGNEADRVNKRLLQFQQDQQQQKQQQGKALHQRQQQTATPMILTNGDIEPPLKKQRREHAALLQQMEQIQSQLLDEMNACADDADLRGD